MKNVRLAITATALTIILSTSAMAGNIGGMRSDSEDNNQANVAGNIGLRSETETSLLGQLEIFIKGNIGLLVNVY